MFFTCEPPPPREEDDCDCGGLRRKDGSRRFSRLCACACVAMGSAPNSICEKGCAVLLALCDCPWCAKPCAHKKRGISQG